MIRRRLLGVSAAIALTAGLAVIPAVSASAGSYSVADVWSSKQLCIYDQSQLKHQGYRIAYSCYYTAGSWIVQYYV